MLRDLSKKNYSHAIQDFDDLVNEYGLKLIESNYEFNVQVFYAQETQLKNPKIQKMR